MSDVGSGLRLASARAGALAFLTAAVTLVVQVLVHRIISAKLLNNYAFLVISLTMLGFALSGAVLARFSREALAFLEDVVVSCAALFVITAIGCTVVFYHSDVGPQVAHSRAIFLRAAVTWMPLALLFAVPFAFVGLILGLLLSAPDLPTRRIYFFDLIGSGVGALAVIPAISILGVEVALVTACAAMLVGTRALVRPRGPAARALLASAALVLIATGALGGRAFDMRYPDGSMLAYVQRLGLPYGIEHTVWDPVARIEVARIPPVRPDAHPYPSLIGGNAAFLSRFERQLTQNNYAFTYAVHYDGNKESLRGIEETIYSAAYQAGTVPRPRALVVGVGGGFDVLSALYFDASEVTGVEINAATMGILTRTYRDYFKAWVEDPRVRLVNAEGRHYLSASDRQYDVLQLSGVDSYSGTPGAVHVFSESYLYTQEAFDLYLSRLTPSGVLSMMRLEFRFWPREMLRALATAVAALRRAGVTRPADHVVTVTSVPRNFTALLVKKSPFTAGELDRLQAWADASPFFTLSASPRINRQHANLYQVLLSLEDPGREREFVTRYPLDIRPTTDNRPFFFNYSYWWHVFTRDADVRRAILPAMEYGVILLSLLVGLTAVFCVLLPLRHLSRAAPRLPGRWRYGAFFAAIAIGYMALEIALMQKFGLFLGHPNYSLSIVLASLLLSTGLGSLFSLPATRALGGIRFVGYALAGIVLLEYFLAFPALPRLIALPLGLRAAIAFLLVLPAGACLGVFLPSGLERLKQTAPGLAAWAWGINGIFSVLAPVASVAWSITWGIDALLLAAIPVYMAAGASLPAAGD